jgi:hypothetical protein
MQCRSNKKTYRLRRQAWKTALHYYKRFGTKSTAYKCRYCKYYHLTTQFSCAPPWVEAAMKEHDALKANELINSNDKYMNLLNLGSIQIPLNAATKTFAVLAKRGAGKTYTASVLAEEFAKNNIPFVVFDPIDVWWGLRLAADGKGKGLPVVVFGLEHADIPLTRDMGKEIARAVVDANISCIISTFGMPKVAQRQLIADFAEELLNINNTPRHVFIEEAHEFVPQRVFGAMGKVFAAVEALVVMGRNRGIGVTLINQRAATINKDVLTQLDTLLAFRNVAPQDRKALKEWVEHHSAEGDFEAFMKSLPSLPTGEGWLWSPEFMGRFERITIRKRETFHPDREKLGQNFVMPALNHTDIQSFIEQFAAKKPTEATEVTKAIGAAEPATKSEIITLRNEYETKLMEKDRQIALRESRIQKLETTLDVIRQALGSPEMVVVGEPVPRTGYGASNVNLWIDKVGGEASGAGRILRFLSDKSGLKFSRSQIALAIGMSARGGSFNGYIQLLKRNNLIKETDGQLFISPDL